MRTKWSLALVVAISTAVAGCALNKSTPRRVTETLFGQFGNTGQIIEPKRCLLTVVYLSKPLHDPVVNEAIWNVADEQTVPGETRRLLEANGMRIGVLTGGLPAEVDEAVHAPPPNKIDPAEFNLPDGSNTLIALADSRPTASLLLNQNARAFGKDYQDAGGWLRLTTEQEGPTGVALRFVPEIHHGPILRRYDSLPNNAGTVNTMQFMLKDGQQEDTLRDLAATVTLQPGQVAVIGCLPDRPSSLGAFLFTHAEPNSDRIVQKVLLVWARRTNMGTPGSLPVPESQLEPVEPPELPAFFGWNRDKAVEPPKSETPKTPARIEDDVNPVDAPD
ncbi:MAG: hypothetical protein AB7I30_07910 [Isosphaeraceae bacterium]